jgi:hypothetical protein
MQQLVKPRRLDLSLPNTAGTLVRLHLVVGTNRSTSIGIGILLPSRANFLGKLGMMDELLVFLSKQGNILDDVRAAFCVVVICVRHLFSYIPKTLMQLKIKY